MSVLVEGQKAVGSADIVGMDFDPSLIARARDGILLNYDAHKHRQVADFFDVAISRMQRASA